VVTPDTPCILLWQTYLPGNRGSTYVERPEPFFGDSFAEWLEKPLNWGFVLHGGWNAPGRQGEARGVTVNSRSSLLEASFITGEERI